MRKRTSGLQSVIRVKSENVGTKSDRRVVRRALLLDSMSGRIRELPTCYIYRCLGQRALNTHKAVLRDLAFFEEYCFLNWEKNKSWQHPEYRVSLGELPLTPREIEDFARWCPFPASGLVDARAGLHSKIQRVPFGKAVRGSTVNARLRNVSLYLQWLLREFVEGDITLDGELLAKGEKAARMIRNAFDKQYHQESKEAPVRSLEPEESNKLRLALHSLRDTANTAHQIRNHLIVWLLYESGIRAGEALKIRCTDVLDDYQIEAGKTIGLIEIIKRPNDHHDERVHEPAVKTLPGSVPVTRSLAASLREYIRTHRRLAMKNRIDGKETPYLFVCHSGRRTGKPIAQRTLNQIVKNFAENYQLPHWLSPHPLRHTHFTELAEIAGEKNCNPTDVINARGRWSPNSNTSERYIQRELIARAARLIAERDRILWNET